MNIHQLSPINNNLAFGVNLHSPKLKFKRDDFFVKIHGYGRNTDWADIAMETADSAVNMVRKETPVESVLRFITAGIRRANLTELNPLKRQYTGLLRTPREGWQSAPNEVFTEYINTARYRSYADRLNMTCIYPLNEIPNGVGISRPENFREIAHGEKRYINSSLDYVFKVFKKIMPKYVLKEIKPENLPDFNDAMAEMRWVLAHSTPWFRGSDAISNVFMRTIYKAAGVKCHPLKKGVSLDLEAYCTELKDYKQNFPNYFENPPEVVE